MRRLHRLFAPKLLDPRISLLARQLGQRDTVLDVGCGANSPVTRLKTGYRVGLDVFLPYLLEARRRGTHDDFVLADANHLPLKDRSLDCVVALDVVEHLEKQRGYELIAELERVAKRRVVVTTPNGFIPTPDAEIPWQEHRSGWIPDEFRRLGYRVCGFGLKVLRQKASRVEMRLLGFMLFALAGFSYLIVKQSNPEYSGDLFCVKLVENALAG